MTIASTSTSAALTPAPSSTYLSTTLPALLATVYLHALLTHFRALFIGTPIDNLRLHIALYLQAWTAFLTVLALETGRCGWTLCEFTLTCAPWSPYC